MHGKESTCVPDYNRKSTSRFPSVFLKASNILISIAIALKKKTPQHSASEITLRPWGTYFGSTRGGLNWSLIYCLQVTDETGSLKEQLRTGKHPSPDLICISLSRSLLLSCRLRILFCFKHEMCIPYRLMHLHAWSTASGATLRSCDNGGRWNLAGGGGLRRTAPL